MLLFLRQVKTVEDYFAGEWDEAVARLDEFIAQAEASPHYQEGGLRAIRALIRSSRSDLEGATADVDSGLAAARTAGDPQAVGPAVSIAVRTYVMAGDRRRATNVLLELIDFIRTHPQEAIFASNVGFVVVELGVERELVELLGPAQDGESPWVTAARAMAQGRFLEAADTYASMPVLPFEAEARLRAAEQLLTEGRRAEADEQLRLASAFWRSVGATWFLREADQLLAATA